MYRVYAWTSGGVKLYIAQYATKNEARWWMHAWMKNGFIPIAQNDNTKEYVMSVHGPEIQVVFFEFDLGPEPTPDVELDPIDGIDNGE